MPIGDDTFAYRRDLPHLQKAGKFYFVTFVTRRRWILPPEARAIVLECCLHEHARTLRLNAAVIMPDHVHLVFATFDDQLMATIIGRIKSVSARLINTALKRTGPVWQREYFDHILRSDESTRAKCEYLCQNPVRSGLAVSMDGYPWLWRDWVEGSSLRIANARM